MTKSNIDATGESREFVTMNVGSQLCGIPVLQVQDVLDPTWRKYSEGVYRLKEGLLVVLHSDNLLDYGAAAAVSA